jgi:hypothetical protein
MKLLWYTYVGLTFEIIRAQKGESAICQRPSFLRVTTAP